MGTWGPGPFDNDGAADWAAYLQESIEQSNSCAVTQIKDSLNITTDSPSWEQENAIAASAIVCLMNGADLVESVYAQDAHNWARSTGAILPFGELRTVTRQALKAIRTIKEPKSGFFEGWHEDAAIKDNLTAIEHVLSTAAGF